MQLDQELSRRDMCVGIILSAIHLAGIARAPENIQAGTSYRLMPLGFTVDSLTVHAPPLDDMAEALLLMAAMKSTPTILILVVLLNRKEKLLLCLFLVLPLLTKNRKKR